MKNKEQKSTVWLRSFFALFFVGLFCFGVQGTAFALPKIQEVRWAAQPNNSSGEKVWRYVLDFSEPVKKKPEIYGMTVKLPGVDLTAMQGKSYGSGTIPKMTVGKASGVVTLNLENPPNRNFALKVFALKADPKSGKKERIVVEITETKGSSSSTGGSTPGAITGGAPTVKSVQINESGYSVQRISVDLKQVATVTPIYDDGDSGVMEIQLSGLKAPSGDTSYTFEGGELVRRVRVLGTGGETYLVFPMSVYFRKEDIRISYIQGDPKKKTSTIMNIDIRRKLPDYQYSLTAGLKGKIIAIDPGHGGSDPGAVGPSGVTEKQVTLAIAKRLGDKLTAAGAKVFYTRTTDVDVAQRNASGVEELHKRIEVAHKNKADIFISIHADSFTSASAGGSSAWYYENSKYDKILAAAIGTNAIPAGGLQNRGVREANFYVLKNSWVPSTLFEVAFISNPNEERLLTQAVFQDKIAQGLYKGIEEYFRKASGGQ